MQHNYHTAAKSFKFKPLSKMQSLHGSTFRSQNPQCIPKVGTFGECLQLFGQKSDLHASLDLKETLQLLKNCWHKPSSPTLQNNSNKRKTRYYNYPECKCTVCRVAFWLFCEFTVLCHNNITVQPSTRHLSKGVCRQHSTYGSSHT